MEFFLPTEIARLVYGYLIEEDCHGAAKLFLETSQHLKECLLVLNKGRRFNTRVSGHNLIEILDILSEATCIVKTHSEDTTKNNAENIVLQLKTLLIPPEVKKVRHSACRNEKSLTSVGNNEEYKQNEVATICETEKENAVQEEEINSLLDSSFSPCKNSTLNNDTMLEKKRSNDNVERTDVCTPSEIFEAMKNISDTLVQNQSAVKVCELKENYKDGMIKETTNIENISTTVQQIDSSRVDLAVHCNENIAKADCKFGKSGKLGDSVNNSKTDTTKNNISMPFVLPTTISKNSLPMLPPISIQQLCSNNTKSPIFANSFQLNARMQLKTVAKTNLSLNHQPEIIQGNDHLLNLQSTNYSINHQPLICIKTPTKNQFRPNIFTSEHRPKSPTTYREIVENSSSSVESNQVSIDNNVSRPAETVELKNNKNSLNESSEIVRSGVRTRGGYRKRGGKVQRRVKAHLPKPVCSPDNKQPVIPGIAQNYSNQPCPTIIEMTVTNSENSVNPSSEKLPEATKTVEKDISYIGKTAENITENCSKKRVEETAEKLDTAAVRNFKKKGSSSVPRRGSHIRALEFKTPIKNLHNRRSLTSPKQLPSNRSPPTKKSLRCVRVTLFKSPNSKKESNAWDADLRKCLSESADIPASVGLKRKTVSESVQETNPNEKQTKSTDQNQSKANSELIAESTVLRSEDTNDTLAVKIQKEVLSVIGEEDMNFIAENSNHSKGSNKILCANNSLNSDKSKSNIFIGSANADEEKDEEQVTVDNHESPVFSCLNNGLLGEKNSTRSIVSPERAPFMTPVSKVLQEHREILATGLLTPGTPLNNITLSPSRENQSKNYEDSSLKLVSSSSNLICQDSLEASLIKECKRIETENLHKNTEQLVPSGEESKSDSIFNTPEKLVKSTDCEFNLNVLSINDTLRKSLSVCCEQKTGKNIICECDLQFNSSVTDTEPKNVTNDSPELLIGDINESPVRRLPSDNENSKKNTSIESNYSSNEIEVFENQTCSGSEMQKVDDVNAKPDKVIERSKQNNHTNNACKSSFSASIEENEISPESHTVSAERKAKTSLVNLKSKNYRQKYEIDCSKLIAKCLQSAKENLYGVNNKLTSSPPEQLTQKVTRARNVRLAKEQNVCSTPLTKKNANSFRNISTRSDSPKFKKQINYLLFSDSDSSSSSSSSDKEDSNVSEMQDEKSGCLNESKENEDALTKLESVNQIVSPSSPIHSIDADSVDFNDLSVDKSKNKLSIGMNESNLDKKQLKEKSPINQKENTRKSLRKKTGHSLDEKLVEKDIVQKSGNLNHHKEIDEQVNATDSRLEAQNRRYSVDRCDFSKGNMNNKTLDCRNTNNLSPSVSCPKLKENFEGSPKLQDKFTESGHKFSEKLSNYTYTFALKLDGVNVTKQLTVSPFFSIIEMECLDEHASSSVNSERAEKDCCTLSEKKNKKRRRDHHVEKDLPGYVSNSSEEEMKSSPVKKSKRSADKRHSDSFSVRNERLKSRRYADSRVKRSPVRYLKSNYNRQFREYNVSRLRRYSTSHCRFSHPEAPKSRRRASGSSRKERHRKDESSSKRSSHRTKDVQSPESSRRFHKDRVETKKSREVLKPRSHSLKENGNFRSPTHYSSRSLKDKKKQTHGLDIEDGELSESSLSIYSSRPVEISSPSNYQRTLTIQSSASPVDEDTRAKLKKLNLDHFLSILHGKEKLN